MGFGEGDNQVAKGNVLPHLYSKIEGTKVGQNIVSGIK